MKITIKNKAITLLAAIIWAFTISSAQADAVTEWNQRAGDIVVKADIGPLPAERALAMVHAAVYEAVNAITRKFPVSDLNLKADLDASVEAAIAAANRTVLSRLAPSQQAMIDISYHAAL